MSHTTRGSIEISLGKLNNISGFIRTIYYDIRTSDQGSGNVKGSQF